MSTFHLQIVTPDGLFFDGQAERVLVRTIVGDVCILPKHTEYLTAIGMGEAKVVVNGEARRAACIGGMLSVNKDEVRIAATTFEWAEEIDIDRAMRAKAKAEEILSQKLEARDEKLAQAKLSRALVRINVGK